MQAFPTFSRPPANNSSGSSRSACPAASRAFSPSAGKHGSPLQRAKELIDCASGSPTLRQSPHLRIFPATLSKHSANRFAKFADHFLLPAHTCSMISVRRSKPRPGNRLLATAIGRSPGLCLSGSLGPLFPWSPVPLVSRAPSPAVPKSRPHPPCRFVKL